MRAPRALATVAVAALLVAVAGCSSDSKSDASSTKKATTTTAASSTSTDATTTTAASSTTAATSTTAGATTTTEDTSGDPGKEGTDSTTSELDQLLPDGWHYGYAAGLEEGKVEGQPVSVLLWDEVQFLTGDAAQKAAEAHGDAPLDTDYYIVNDNQKVRRIAVVPEASITTLGEGGAPEQQPSSIDVVAKQPYLFKILVGTVRGVTTISSVEGVYLP